MRIRRRVRVLAGILCVIGGILGWIQPKNITNKGRVGAGSGGLWDEEEDVEKSLKFSDENPFRGCRSLDEVRERMMMRFYTIGARTLLDGEKITSDMSCGIDEAKARPNRRDMNRFSVAVARSQSSSMDSILVSGTAPCISEGDKRCSSSPIDGVYVPISKYAGRMAFRLTTDQRRKLIFDPEMGGWCFLEGREGSPSPMEVLGTETLLGIAASNAFSPDLIDVPVCQPVDESSDNVIERTNSRVGKANPFNYKCDLFITGGRAGDSLRGLYSYVGQEYQRPIFQGVKSKLFLSSRGKGGGCMLHNGSFDETHKIVKGVSLAENDNDNPLEGSWRIRDSDSIMRPDQDFGVFPLTSSLRAIGMLISGRLGTQNTINDLYIPRCLHVWEGVRNKLELRQLTPQEITGDVGNVTQLGVTQFRENASSVTEAHVTDRIHGWKIVDPCGKEILARFKEEKNKRHSWKVKDIDTNFHNDFAVRMQINTSRYILYDNRCGRHVVETRSGTDSQFDMLFTASQSWIYRALCSIQASTPIINTAPSVANYHNTLKKAVDNQISTEKSEEEFPGSIPLSMCVGYAGGSLIFRRILGCSPDMMVVLYADRTTGEEVALRIFTAMPLSLYQFNKAVVERDIQRTVRERLEGLSGFVTYPKSLSGVRHLSSCHGWPCLVEEVMKTHSLQHLFYTMRNVIKDTLSEAIRLNLENKLHLPSHSVSPPDGTRRNPSAEKALLGIRGVLRKTIVCYRGVAGSILGAYTRNVTVNRDLLAHDILFPGIIHDTSALSIISQKESSSSNGIILNTDTSARLQQVVVDPPFPLGLMAQIGEFWRIYGYLKTLLRLPEPVVFFLDTVKIASGVQPGRTAMQISCRRLLHIAENALTEFDALESDERAESDTSVLDFLDVQRRWHSS